MRARTVTILVLSAVIAGIAVGIGGYTFIYAKGYSYLTNNPEACANCHVMNDQYAGWVKSSHRSVAVCNDCHTPPGLIPKYAIKARNGFFHSLYFTTGKFPEPIRITSVNMNVTERACRKCHEEIVQEIDRVPGHGPGAKLSCIRCHTSVGHLE